MNNTYQILINWDKGQPFAERLAAKILSIEGYQDIDPQCPTGGPDGTKDILSNKNGNKCVVGCYFPNGQKEYGEIKTKFENDLVGVSKNNADEFIFVTNQKITPSERLELCQAHNFGITIFHGERVCSILDGPKGYGIRLEYLGIELTREEQISFLNSHLDLKAQFDEIQKSLFAINKVTTKLAGEFYERDMYSSAFLSSLPISGVNFSSRLSIEDLLSLHTTILQESGSNDFINFLGFRKVEVWIGNLGTDKSLADFIPTPPSDVLKETYELLKWWREEYMKICYDTENKKISAIAEFHVRFLSIHPFVDGNGRVARTIASIQYKDLLHKDVIFESVERGKYYAALQAARTGEKQVLIDLFKALMI